MNLNGLPLLHGTNTPLDPGELNGTTVPYDLQFILKHSISTIGGSADWAFNPAYESGRLTVRPIFGGRHLRLNESLQFYGEGSTLAWGTADADAPVNVKVPTPADGETRIMTSSLTTSVKAPEEMLRATPRRSYQRSAQLTFSCSLTCSVT